MTFRTALNDTAIGGTGVRRGEGVGFVLGAGDRDPARFPEPDRLDVGRSVGKIASFGMGIHFCLGAALARLEGEIAFATLLRRCPDLRLTSDAAEWRPGIVFHGLRTLPVAW